MPSLRRRLRERASSPQNIGLLVSTVLAIVAAYATELFYADFSTGFLALVVVGLGTPNTLDTHGLLPTALTSVLIVVTLACLLSWAGFLVALAVAQNALEGYVAVGAAFVGTILVAELVGRALVR